MPTTDEELQKKREENEKLRSQIAAAEAKRVQNEQLASNDIVAAQLDAENARLQAELTLAQDGAKKSTINEGTADLTATVKDDLKAADLALKGAQAATTTEA